MSLSICSMLALAIAATPDGVASAAETVDTTVRLGGDAVTLRHEPGSWLVGAPISLIVIAEPGDRSIATIELPEDGRLGVFDFTIRPAPRIAGLPFGSAVVALEISSFASGVLELPPIEVLFETGDGGEVRTIFSPPLELEVRSVLEAHETADPRSAIRPLKPAVRMGPHEAGTSAIWWLASIGLTTAVLVGGLLLISRRRPPAEPHPSVWARARLAAIRADDAPSSTAAQWEEAAALLRGLLERRDGLDALDRTTAELGGLLDADDRFDDVERRDIVDVLEQADLVKFAGVANEGLASALDAVERVIDSGERREAATSREAAA